MGDTFIDIKIKALDDAASGPSGQGVLLRMVLKLSAWPPAEWANYFNQAWNQHLYMTKRRAAVIGDSIEIICALHELEADHIPELNKIISETNQAYGKFAAERDRIRHDEEERAKRQKQELSTLKGRLKFD